ncbi:hypothetical protein RY831_32830 [Noviherbaspirillum sp. CPCC 100848]|uniref:NADH:flavin oxidoreductase/NADH oxidase N-terminal domain-containing protein n=1 Tax=Noviherbaspirillum album TaxID=3080276 RepID=A0ABU6JJQ2_9BURK|nr:hypothetical protein [Noviherbaspirillum sp. CPCC 100848]MEC4723889.1 hypothetical protein [Noviherbaspirillum sp. CPCC 100848]
MAPDAPLLSPFTIGTLSLKNRIAVAPMTRVSATEDGHATDDMVRYYQRFAAGGFGLVITEGTYPDMIWPIAKVTGISQVSPTTSRLMPGVQWWRPSTKRVPKS